MKKNNQISEDLFNKIKEPTFFIRVNENHPLELSLGLNSKGEKTFLFTGLFKPKRINGTSYIDVNQYKNGNLFSINFSLTNNNLYNIFYNFCDDLISNSDKIKDEILAYNFFIDRFLAWKKMFYSKKSILTESEIMGLIGELLVLKNNCFQKYDYLKSLQSWSGSKKTNKDFSINEHWIEVKTISVNSISIKINSLEQLDSPNEGNLVVIKLEKMSPEYDGITLNQLVMEIMNELPSDLERDIFINLLDEANYGYDISYDSYVYELKDTTIYRINDKFPKLTRSNTNTAIIKASYELSLTSLELLTENIKGEI